MSAQRWRRGAAWVVLCGIGWALQTAPAFAQPSTAPPGAMREAGAIREPNQGERAYRRSLEHSVGHAFPLAEREFSVGLWRLEYGIFDFLTVGTGLPAWFLGIPFSTTFPNGYIRFGGTVDDVLGLGGRVGATYLDLGQVLAATSTPDVAARLWVIPVAFTATLHVDAFSASVEALYTLITGDPASAPDEETGVGAVTYADTLQLRATLQARASPELAFIAEFRCLPYQGPLLLGVDGTANEGATRFSGELEVNAALQHSAAALGGIFLTFGAFNFRAAAGWGRFFVPDIGLVAPFDFVQIDLDLYFRFRLNGG